ncbi:hypothetical protein [Aminobacter ciceronei]|uniref:Plasmid stability protein n=1 Tax=Aminobacter ciceronei TaxID=150723 RepID=A0ABR6C1G5_9HYPH|nr:hypothetical protein [Aminobacter ciceronei]MBA8904879.1 plasmid stability protein [Aminobacter ciceronei]MBA9018567.1 plasmid stability protein [Aminobacter ciceronei]
MDTLADYDAWKSKQQQATAAAAGIVLDTINVKPDEIAGDLQLAQEYARTTGRPTPPLPLVQENRSIFQQQIERKRNSSILSSSPMLAEWLRKPENSALARDDLEGLSLWEIIGSNIKEAGKAVPGGAVSSLGTAMEGAGQILTPRDPSDRAPLAQSIAGAGRKTPEEIAALRAEIFQQGVINPQVAQSVLSDVIAGDMTMEEALTALEPALAPALGAASEALQSGGEAVQDFGAGILPAAQGMEDSFGRDVGSGLGSLLTILGVGLVTGGSGAAVFGGAAGAGEAASRARRGGQDEDTQTIAALYGIFPGMTDAIPIERLIANPVVKSGLASILRSIGKQVALEGGQEAVQNILQNAIAKNLYAPDQDPFDGVMRAIQTGGFVGGLVEAGRIGLNAIMPGRYRRAQQAAGRAEEAEAKIKEIQSASVTSVLRNRMPDAFRDFVARATANGPVENVYVPASEWVEYFQSSGVDPFLLADELDGVNSDDLRTALATGGDLQIPTATYAAKMAGSDHDAFLMENMRFDPDEMTAREAREFNERAEDAMQEAFEEADRMRQDDEQYRSFEAKIYDEMVSRLRVSGRSTDVATSEAMLYPAFYRVMAERSGLTTEEFIARYPLPQVRGDVPQGMQLKNVDALTRTLAEARAQKAVGVDRRQTLLEFISDYGGIVDRGGELKARDAEVVDRGRGKKKLRLARKGVAAGMRDMFGNAGRKFGPDDVALAAIEAGFMADHPVVLAYKEALTNGGQVPDIGAALWDAIDAEIGGIQQFSVDQAAPEAGTDADEIERYLSAIGLSLDDSDDAIRAAVEADQAEEVRRYGQSGDVRGARGSVQFPLAGVGNGDSVISLFKSADLSTFIHESGHYFLTVMQDLSARGEIASAQDFAAIKEWWRSNADDVVKDAARVMPDVKLTSEDVIAALENGSTGDLMKDAAVDVGMQEQWARAFEAYLLEGKAPSIELRGAFEKFRAWLISIYKNLAGLNISPSDELRAVFDRMLATDDEIAKARQSSADVTVFATAEEMGLSPEDYAAFLKLRDQSTDEAHAKLLAETMAPIKREREKWYREERAKVRDDVEIDVSSQRVYRAIEWMGNRRWFGEAQPETMGDIRLSKDILVDRYGAGVLKTLPRGKQTVYAVEGGLDPDDAAGVFGYGSGDELVKAMEQAPGRKQAIEDQTDRVMFERHGDVLRDGSIEAAAMDAVHGDKRARVLALELDALNRRAGRPGGKTSVAEIREIARRTTARMRVRDAMNSNRYLAAERKTGEQAYRMASADDLAGASEAKRRQLLNHALYSEARRIGDEVEAAERLVSRLQKKSTRQNLAGRYLEAIDELLFRYDFRRISGRKEDMRGALEAYVEQMKADGRENEISIPDDVLKDVGRTPYKSLSVEHLRGVVDSLKNIAHTARHEKKLTDAQSQRELDEVVGDIIAAFDANVKKRPPSRVATKAEQRRGKVRQFLDLVLNAGTILREIDGFADMGATYRNIKAPLDDAMNRLQVRRRNAAVALDDLYSVYSKDERRRMAVRELVPELGYALSKWEKIAVALNTGNEGNYQRLTDQNIRGSMSEDQVEAIVQSLDERDAKFVQSVWDYLETFRADIEAREKRATGISPKWVEARPVEIAGKVRRGGYYPLRYDPRLSSLARDDAAQDIATSLQAGRFGKAQTRNGHLKERASSSGRAIEIDIAVLHKHVNQVVYDLELSEPVAASWRILQDARVRGQFIDAGKQADFDALEIWLKDVAEGEVKSADWVGQAARRFKSNFTAAKLAFNLGTVAVQITGLSQTMVVVGKKDFLAGLMMMRRPAVVGEVAAKSTFMSDRQTTFNKDIFDLYNDPKLGPTMGRWAEFRNEWLAPLGLWLMTKVQFYAVDVPTWLAGYQQGLRRFGGDEDKAVAHADAIVKRAQASGVFSDRSAIERGSVSQRTRQNDVVRLFTTLGSYMFAKFNVAYERTAKAGKVIEQEGASGRSAVEVMSWTLDMAFLFALEAVLYAAIKGGLPDDEDDDDSWTKFLMRETALSVVSTIPFVRDIGGSLSGFSGGGAYGSMTEELAKPLKEMAQGDVDRAFVKSVISATGLFTGIPSSQINRAVDAGWREMEGDDVSPVEYVMGRAKK